MYVGNITRLKIHMNIISFPILKILPMLRKVKCVVNNVNVLCHFSAVVVELKRPIYFAHFPNNIFLDYIKYFFNSD